MKIEVTQIGRLFGRQTRAYADYRLFSSLVPFSDTVETVAVVLTPPIVEGHAVVCSVVVSVGAGSKVCVTVRGRHVYDAINRGAHRIGHALRRHLKRNAI